jgi:hypothetical protein
MRHSLINGFRWLGGIVLIVALQRFSLDRKNKQA